MELTPGQQLGHYRIEGKIGQGGMGAVYRATDTRLDREVAVKVLPAEVTANAESRQRFRQDSRPGIQCQCVPGIGVDPLAGARCELPRLANRPGRAGAGRVHLDKRR